jgi:Ca2+/Na+ antiporter
MEIQNLNPAKGKQGNKVTLGQRFQRLVTKNPFVAILLLALIVMFIWFSVKIRSERRTFIKDKNELIARNAHQADSIRVKNIAFAAKVFSWSVRSEMLRGNTENLNQLFTVFIQESGADLAQLINTGNNTIVLSSDKKYEGTKFEKPANVNLNLQTTTTVPARVTVYTPVMGFNKEIGILKVEFVR